MQDTRPGPDRATPTACPHSVAPAACPACRPRLERLGLALLEGHEDEWSCAQFLAAVAALGGTLPQGGGASADDAHLLGHASRCTACAADLAAAQGALAGLLDPGAALPPSIPEFDLSFLRPTAAVFPATGLRQVSAGLALAAMVLLLAWLGRDHRLGMSGPDGRTAPDLASPTVQEAASAPASLASGSSAAPLVPIASPDSGATRTPSAQAMPGTASSRLAVKPSGAVGATLSALAKPEPAPATAQMPSATPAAQVTEPEEPDETDEPPPPSPTVAPPPATAFVSCALHAFGPQSGLFTGRCGPYRSAAAYDLYRVSVSQAGRWTFDTCEDGGGLDTVLVLYPAGGFDPAAPCQGILASADDGCGGLSRLTVDLAAGAYLLLVSEQSGDLSDHYRLGVEAPAGNDACPRTVDGPPTAVPASPSPPALPSPTAGAEGAQPPAATPEPQTGAPTPGEPTATPVALP